MGNSTGIDNNAFGYHSLYNNKIGGQNSAFGSYSLSKNDSGSYNSCFGYNSLSSNTKGYSNAAFGDLVMNHNTIGYYNAAIGSKALQLSTSANNTVGVGYLAGGAYAKYTKCTFIGATADATATNFTNATAIGYGAKVDASNKVRVGSTAITSIGGQVGWTTLSDARLKENIKESKLGLDFILILHPVTYNYKDENQKGIIYTGLIAQEVDAAAKKEGIDFSGVDKNGEYWGIRYGDLTVPLVTAMQEQQSVIDAQQNEIKGLKTDIAAIKSLLTADHLQKVSSNTAIENKLEQNNPNPFSEKTTINYSVSNEAVSAAIIIRNMNGVELKRIILEKSNAGNVIIEGNQLAQGTYTYTLEVDGKSVDTKLMVTTK